MIDVSKTTNPIIYNWKLAGVSEAYFELYPYRRFHDENDIEETMEYLKNRHDVLSIVFDWMDKEIFDSHTRQCKKKILMYELQIVNQLKELGRLGMNKDKKLVDLRLFPDAIKVTNINKIINKK